MFEFLRWHIVVNKYLTYFFHLNFSCLLLKFLTVNNVDLKKKFQEIGNVN